MTVLFDFCIYLAWALHTTPEQASDSPRSTIGGTPVANGRRRLNKMQSWDLCKRAQVVGAEAFTPALSTI